MWTRGKRFWGVSAALVGMVVPAGFASSAAVAPGSRVQASESADAVVRKASAPAISPSPVRAGEPVIARGSIRVRDSRRVRLQVRPSPAFDWKVVGVGHVTSGRYRIASEQIRESHQALFRVVAPAVRINGDRRPRVVSEVYRAEVRDRLAGSLRLVSVEEFAKPSVVDGPALSDDRVSTAIFVMRSTYIEDLATGTRRTVSDEDLSELCDVSADGTRLLFRTSAPYSDEEAMRLLHVGTGVSKEIPTPSDIEVECGMLSADGRRTVYKAGGRLVVQNTVTGELGYAPGEGYPWRGWISANGRRFAYTLSTDGRDRWEEKRRTNVMVWNRATGAVKVVETRGKHPQRTTTLAGFAPSGAFILMHRYFSEPYDQLENPNPRSYHVLDAVDVASGEITRIDGGNFRNQRNISESASVSSNSRYVTYMSDRRDLTVGSDRNGERDFFRYDMVTGRTLRLTNHHGRGAYALNPISADGQRLLVQSSARLSDADSDNLPDLFLWQIR